MHMKDVNQRVAITNGKFKFLVTLYPFETIRSKKKPIDERLCPLCKRSVGDEFHCLIE